MYVKAPPKSQFRSFPSLLSCVFPDSSMNITPAPWGSLRDCNGDGNDNPNTGSTKCSSANDESNERGMSFNMKEPRLLGKPWEGSSGPGSWCLIVDVDVVVVVVGFEIVVDSRHSSVDP